MGDSLLKFGRTLGNREKHSVTKLKQEVIEISQQQETEMILTLAHQDSFRSNNWEGK